MFQLKPTLHLFKKKNSHTKAQRTRSWTRKQQIGKWVEEYNAFAPHSALKMMTPGMNIVYVKTGGKTFIQKIILRWLIGLLFLKRHEFDPFRDLMIVFSVLSAPHLGHFRGSTSYTPLMSVAHVKRHLCWRPFSDSCI